MKCFETLGLSPTATTDEVKSRWRALSGAHHPDRGGSADDFDKYRKAYNEALKYVEKSVSEPLECGSCAGIGHQVLIRGFSILKMLCKACGGKGHVRRT